MSTDSDPEYIQSLLHNQPPLQEQRTHHVIEDEVEVDFGAPVRENSTSTQNESDDNDEGIIEFVDTEVSYNI